MPDKPPLEVVPIHFAHYVVRTVEKWPERTSFFQHSIANPYLMGATVDGAGETTFVMFEVFNGKAAYRLNRDVPGPDGSIVADLVSSKRTSRRP